MCDYYSNFNLTESDRYYFEDLVSNLIEIPRSDVIEYTIDTERFLYPDARCDTSEELIDKMREIIETLPGIQKRVMLGILEGKKQKHLVEELKKSAQSISLAYNRSLVNIKKQMCVSENFDDFAVKPYARVIRKIKKLAPVGLETAYKVLNISKKDLNAALQQSDELRVERGWIIEQGKEIPDHPPVAVKKVYYFKNVIENKVYRVANVEEFCKERGLYKSMLYKLAAGGQRKYSDFVLERIEVVENESNRYMIIDKEINKTHYTNNIYGWCKYYGINQNAITYAIKHGETKKYIVKKVEKNSATNLKTTNYL